MKYSSVPSIDLRQLHAYRIVARELHYSRAAKILGITQPPLSQQIRRLEDAIGCRLLDRDTRSVRRTPAGQAMLDLAEDMLERFFAGVTRIEALASGRAGQLSIGFTPATALYITEIVRVFQLKCPEVMISMAELPSPKIAHALQSGQIDIAIARDNLNISDVDATLVISEGYVAILPESSSYKKDSPYFDMEQVKDEEFIMVRRDKVEREMNLAQFIFNETEFFPNKIREVADWQGAAAMVGAGLGVSVFSETAGNLKFPGITAVPVKTKTRAEAYIINRSDDVSEMALNFINETAGSLLLKRG